MKRPLYYLLCAIACTSMVGATLPMPAIAEAIQPQETAEQQAQADATSSDTGKAEDGTNANATADTVEDGTATSTGASAVNTESAGGTPTANATDTAAPGTAAATGTPAPSLRAQATPTPEAISATAQSRLRPLRHRNPKRRHLHRLVERRPRGHRDDLPPNPGQRLVPGQSAHGRAHLLGRRQPGKRLRPVAPGMGQLLQPSGPRSRSGPKNPRGTTIHLHGASEGAYPKSEMVKPAAARCRGARPAE